MAKIIKKDAENVTVGLDNGTFEVYPLSKTENEYVAITITEEFTDYEVVALTYGTTRPIYVVDGVEKELVAYHDGDTFTAELISTNR